MGIYRLTSLLFIIYKLFTWVTLNKISKVLNKGQLCEQAVSESVLDRIHTVASLIVIEVSRENRILLCLKFMGSNKAFDTFETESIIEAVDNRVFPIHI